WFRPRALRLPGRDTRRWEDGPCPRGRRSRTQESGLPLSRGTLPCIPSFRDASDKCLRTGRIEFRADRERFARENALARSQYALDLLRLFRREYVEVGVNHCADHFQIMMLSENM